MRHVKVTFAIASQETTDMLMAILCDIGFNGFEETENELLAYIGEEEFDKFKLDAIAVRVGLTYETETIAQQNWNALWESNFQPVVVEGICTIRAHFHDIVATTPYEIVITPKMSFGTGHHATTQLMIMLMSEIDFAGKTVLDFGTGTGVLAIFAELRGAERVLAIDNDEWSVENALENVDRNHSTHISVMQGSVEDMSGSKYDIILANINRHILLQYMGAMYEGLNNNGSILMSGLLIADREIIVDAAAGVGFQLIRVQEQDNWIGLLLKK